MSQVLSAAEHREAAAEARREAAESFERSDTDGFLSQWASGMTAREHDAKAKLAENGGMTEITALFFNGEFASVNQKFGQYGEFWVLNDAAADAFGKRFYSPSKAKNAIERDRAKGFTYGVIKVRGYVTIAAPAGAKGLSGATQAFVATYPVWDDVKAGAFEVISTDGAFAHLGKG